MMAGAFGDGPTDLARVSGETPEAGAWNEKGFTSQEMRWIAGIRVDANDRWASLASVDDEQLLSGIIKTCKSFNLVDICRNRTPTQEFF